MIKTPRKLVIEVENASFGGLTVAGFSKAVLCVFGKKHCLISMLWTSFGPFLCIKHFIGLD
jgi:hypothetical protein